MESVYGGLRAVVMVPAELIERVVTPSASDDAWPADEPVSVSSGPAVAPGTNPRAGEDAAPAPLPQRRSRRGEGSAAPTPEAPSGATRLVQTQTAEEAGAWMGAFFSPTAVADRADPTETDDAGGNASQDDHDETSIEPSAQAGGVAEDR
jgi:hypothetical protein